MKELFQTVTTETINGRRGHVDIYLLDDPNQSPHLTFVDITVVNVEGQVIELDQIDAGKLIHVLQRVQRHEARPITCACSSCYECPECGSEIDIRDANPL